MATDTFDQMKRRAPLATLGASAASLGGCLGLGAGTGPFDGPSPGGDGTAASATCLPERVYDFEQTGYFHDGSPWGFTVELERT